MKERRKKILSSGTALLCVLAILVSGTLAFLGAARATNSFVDVTNPPEAADLTGANLHDDFAGMQGISGGVIDKDVYVENTGNKPVFVRIKLTEVIGGTSQLFMPKLDTAGAMTGAGNVAGFEWTLGSDTPKNYNSIKDTAQWGTAANPGAQTHLVGDALGQATITGVHADTGAVTTGTAGQTLDQDGVISMKQYFMLLAEERVAFQGWIYDVDGFAYWSKPLEPNTATGRLLDSVKVPARGTSTYTYDIVVDMEFVDEFDINAWVAEGTDGEREVVTNTFGQWNQVETKAEGAIIQTGLKAGNTTMEATAEAKRMLNISLASTKVRVLSDAQTGDGEWIELTRNGEYSLIVKSDTAGTSRYSDTGSFIAYKELGNSGINLRRTINNWYNSTLAPTAPLRDFVVGHDALEKPGAWGSLSASDGFSAPTGAAAGTTDVAFPLSFQEAAKYMAMGWNGDAGYTSTSIEAMGAWYKLETPTWSWLRTIGASTNNASYIGSNGGVEDNGVRNASTSSGRVRPALWVRSDIFD